MAYGLQRFGGVFRPVAGYVDGKQVIQLPNQGWNSYGGAEHHQYASDDSSGGENEDDDDESIVWDDRPEEERRDTAIEFDQEDDSDPDADIEMDEQLTEAVKSIQLIPRKSMQ